MRNNIVLVAGIVVGLTTSAHISAAPSTPGTVSPVAPGGVTPLPAHALIQQGLDLDVIPTALKCGSTNAITFKLTNKVGAQAVSVSFTTLSAAGAVTSHASKAVNLPGKESLTVTLTALEGVALDCHAALGTQRVFAVGSLSAQVAKELHPTVFTMLRIGAQPPPTNKNVWVRRVEVAGACGTIVSPIVTLHSFASATQPATTTLTFGGTTKTSTVNVPANTNTQVTLPLTTALDCQHAGIPAFDYSLQNGSPNDSGKLEVSDVTFTP